MRRGGLLQYSARGFAWRIGALLAVAAFTVVLGLIGAA